MRANKVLAELCAVLFVVMLAGMAIAAVPQTMNYQGYLTDSTGQAVNGPVNFTFALYSAASGGSLLWTEAHSGVSVVNGVYSVVLGNASPTPNPITLPFDTQYWLGISIGRDELLPRQALTVSPYAFRAGQADTVNSASQIVSTVTTGTAPLAVSSTTVVPNLNADTVDSKHAADFAASGANTDITSISGLNTQAAIVVNPYAAIPRGTGQIRMQELAANGTNFVALRAPDSLAANWVMTLPAADGTANQVMKTDGAGHLGWLDMNTGTQVQSVTGTDPNGMIRGTNTATPSLGYLGGTYGVYGEAAGNNSAGVYGRNNIADGSANAGYGVKGVSANSVGALGGNQVCTEEPYDCNCDWDSNAQQIVCDTCYQSVCNAVTGVGVYGQAVAPAYAGYFAGDVGVAGQVLAGSFSATGQVSAGTFVGNGSQLSNITAAHIGINCAEGQILKKISGTWQCRQPCEVGDMVTCYTGLSGTMNVGICKAGVRTCGPTGWGSCDGATLPAPETCNGLDDDCDGVVDDVEPSTQGCVTFYRDNDGDGFGVANDTICTCSKPAGYATVAGDCNDANPNVRPDNVSFYEAPISGITPPSWDYNCDGQNTKRYTVMASQQLNQCDGWAGGTVPECGQTADYTTCYCVLSSCGPYGNEPRTQICK